MKNQVVQIRFAETSPGYEYEALTPSSHWSSDEWYLTRRGAVRYQSVGSGPLEWQGVHALNKPELYARCVRELGHRV